MPDRRTAPQPDHDEVGVGLLGHRDQVLGRLHAADQLAHLVRDPGGLEVLLHPGQLGLVGPRRPRRRSPCRRARSGSRSAGSAAAGPPRPPAAGRPGLPWSGRIRRRSTSILLLRGRQHRAWRLTGSRRDATGWTALAPSPRFRAMASPDVARSPSEPAARRRRSPGQRRGSTAPAGSGTGALRGGRPAAGLATGADRARGGRDRRSCCSCGPAGPTRAGPGPCPAAPADTTRRPSRPPCARRTRRPACDPASVPDRRGRRRSTTAPGPTPTSWPRCDRTRRRPRAGGRGDRGPGLGAGRRGRGPTRCTRLRRGLAGPARRRIAAAGQEQLTRVCGQRCAGPARRPAPISIRKPSCPYGELIACTGAAAGTAATISSDSRGG